MIEIMRKRVKLSKKMNETMAVEGGERRQHNMDHMVHAELVGHLIQTVVTISAAAPLAC